jgi:hypothetical protein
MRPHQSRGIKRLKLCIDPKAAYEKLSNTEICKQLLEGKNDDQKVTVYMVALAMGFSAEDALLQRS